MIYGGADPQRYAPDPDQPRHGVLFVGRLTPHKGVDRLLQALPERRLCCESSARRATIRCCRSATIPRLLAAPGARQGRRTSRGRCPTPSCRLPIVRRRCWSCPRWRLVLRQADRRLRAARAWPSSKRWPRAHRSSPVALGGVPEIVRDGETGFLVAARRRRRAPRAASARSSAIRRCARRLGDNARQDVLERFTWDSVAERCLAAYSDALARPGPLAAR